MEWGMHSIVGLRSACNPCFPAVAHMICCPGGTAGGYEPAGTH